MPNYIRIIRITLRSFIALFTVITIIFLTMSTRLGKRKNLAYEFNGKVDSISYDIKGEATLFINGEEYYLSDADWYFQKYNTINKGDSMIKKSNSMIIKLFKPNGKIITEGEDN